jgi:hypothetical protein
MKSDKKPNVVIVMAKCRREKATFGIRFEETEPGFWVGMWAFSIKDSIARRENYDKNSINGSILFGPKYPGCPYCKSRGIFLCGKCNLVSCYDGESKTVICPHCNTKLDLIDQIHNLRSLGDR